MNISFSSKLTDVFTRVRKQRGCLYREIFQDLEYLCDQVELYHELALAAANNRDAKLKRAVVAERAAQALGKLGGKANTPAQNAARARNAKLGGRPKKLKRRKPNGRGQG